MLIELLRNVLLKPLAIDMEIIHLLGHDIQRFQRIRFKTVYIGTEIRDDL